MCAALQLMH